MLVVSCLKSHYEIKNGKNHEMEGGMHAETRQALSGNLPGLENLGRVRIPPSATKRGLIIIIMDSPNSTVLFSRRVWQCYL